MEYRKTKQIIYQLTKQENDILINTINQNKEAIDKLYPHTEEFSKTMYKFFPVYCPAGTKSNIEVLIIKFPDKEPKNYCHLNVLEPEGYGFTKILYPNDIDKRSNTIKNCENHITLNNTKYKIEFK